MLKGIVQFFHHLFNPHCEHCKEEREDSRICTSCESLKYQIESLTYQIQKLLEALIQATAKETTAQAPVDISSLKPITPRSIPWSLRKQQLETNSLKEAMKLQEQEQQSEVRVRATNEALAVKTTEELEKSLGVSENAS